MHIIAVDMGTPNHLINTKYGPFSKWFERAYASIDKTILVDGFSAESVDLEDLLECDGVILSGSEQNVGDDIHWLPQFDTILQALIDYKQPVLAVCFSHQYINHYFGGSVARIEADQQHGNYIISLTERGRQDPLFTGVPETCYVMQTHFEKVVKPGNGCVILAEDDQVPVQAFRFGESLWGVQFHPEISQGMMMTMLDELDLEEEELERRKFEANNAHDGLKILDNFARICARKKTDQTIS